MKNKKTAVSAAIALLIMPLTAVIGDSLLWTTGTQKTIFAEGREHSLLSGGAWISSGSIEIVAEEIELFGKDFRYALCRGSVRLTDLEREIILETEVLFFDRQEEIMRIDAYMEMQDMKNEVVVKGGFFEYFGKQEEIIIQIGVRIFKVSEESEIACRSEFARYDRENNVLELSGLPRVLRNDDEYRAARIVVNLDTDEILLEQGVSGTVVESEDQAAPQKP